MRPVLRNRGDEPLVLRGAGTACRVRPWSNDPSIAQLVLFNHSRQPRLADVQQWLGELTRLGFDGVRTGALNPSQAATLEPLGFRCIQELVLLEHTSVRELADRMSGPVDHPPVHPTHRLTAAEHATASEVDRRAFGDPWGLDALAIDDVRRATARHRARWIGACDVDDGDVDRRGTPAGYAISGRDAKVGFLQRLAVDPSRQRQGIGMALVVDSLRWHARWRVNRVLVNTHVHNHAALHLYERVGFRRLPERLRVFEKSLR